VRYLPIWSGNVSLNALRLWAMVRSRIARSRPVRFISAFFSIDAHEDVICREPAIVTATE
jgi:hypothetical protein